MQERLSFRDRLDARSLPRPVEVRGARGSGPVAAPAASAPESPSPTVLFVHVAGLVRHPGVYRFHEGHRVIDAVQAAGGPRRKADLDALNLAALLTDAEQILVPAQGAAAPPVPVVGSAPGVPGAPGALVNVNPATEPELEALPGIGPVLANSIIAYRTEHGPFPTVDALDDVSGIGPATLADLRPLVTV